jgi:hypothetical protein
VRRAACVAPRRARGRCLTRKRCVCSCVSHQDRAWRARLRVLLAGLQASGVPGAAALLDVDSLAETQFADAVARTRRAAAEHFSRNSAQAPSGPPRAQQQWWLPELDALHAYAAAAGAAGTPPPSGALLSLLRAEYMAYLSCMLLDTRWAELEADCAGATTVWAAGDDGAALGEIKTSSGGAALLRDAWRAAACMVPRAAALRL